MIIPSFFTPEELTVVNAYFKCTCSACENDFNKLMTEGIPKGPGFNRLLDELNFGEKLDIFIMERLKRQGLI